MTTHKEIHMTALAFIRTAGTGLALSAILTAGAAPVMADEIWTIPPNEQPAAGSCDWQAPISGCPRPVLAVTQEGPLRTVGTPVVLSGSGFESGEMVSVTSQDGRYALESLAAADGSIRIDWAVPDWSEENSGIMFSAEGTVSQYATEGVQVVQDRANIVLVDGLLHGWHPGEELVITLDGNPMPSAYASADGTSESFLNIGNGGLEVIGKQSGGFFGGAIGNIGLTPPRRPVTPVTPAPELVPAPVIPAPELVLDPVISDPPLVAPNVPAPARPQPQAAVSAQDDPASVGLPLAGASAAVALAGVASFLFARRIRPTDHNTQ
jgi:hypothetical protein